MKIGKRIPQVVKEYIASSYECDRCGKPIRSAGWDENEVNIRARIGEVYPENDMRKEERFDCCVTCWEEHAKRVLLAAGFKLHESDMEQLRPEDGFDRID